VERELADANCELTEIRGALYAATETIATRDLMVRVRFSKRSKSVLSSKSVVPCPVKIHLLRSELVDRSRSAEQAAPSTKAAPTTFSTEDWGDLLDEVNGRHEYFSWIR